MDPENQALIKRIVDEHGDANIVVMLGAADAEAVEVRWPGSSWDSPCCTSSRTT
jgi:hypothetical protein